MLTLEELRKIDPELKDLTDTELEEVRNDLYELGQLAFDVWQEEKPQKSGSKNPVRSLTSEQEKVSIKVHERSK